MLAISARDATMKQNPKKVQIYPQNSSGRPPLMRPPIGAINVTSHVDCTKDVNMIMVDILKIR
jgi:hypothetical protein